MTTNTNAPLKADALAVHINPKTGRMNKNPVYWQAYVMRDGVSIWSDGGWHSKKAALSVASNWIKSRS